MKNAYRGSDVIYPTVDSTNRKRIKILFRFCFFSVLFVLGVFVLVKKKFPPHHPAGQTESKAIAAAITGSDSQPALRRCPEYISRTVKPGETFTTILGAYSIKREHAAELFRALRRAGLSKLYPGDSMTMAFDTACSITKLSLLSRLQYWYNARCADSTITSECRPVPVMISRNLINGVLETSLLDAMQNYGLGPNLACRLSDIFAWDINFFLDPRKGDTFQILFCRKYAEGRCIGYGDILAAKYTCTGRDFIAIGFPAANGTQQYYDMSGKSVQKEFLKAPLRYLRISSGFTYHRLHPILGIVRPHLGIDYAAPAGTPVYAAADGIVREAGWDRFNGNHLEIAHGGAFTTCYGHLATISSGIHRGSSVTQGQMIGTVGATGLATGPHLDYRMKRNGTPVNPLTVILPSKNGIDPSQVEKFNRVKESCLVFFNLRFQQRPGYYLLDIERQPNPDSATGLRSQTCSVAVNGTKSGS
ncbi:MAG: peptidoglycan DD-metalloendopeptidase family protein [Chitinispirillaceae bacterium]